MPFIFLAKWDLFHDNKLITHMTHAVINMSGLNFKNLPILYIYHGSYAAYPCFTLVVNMYIGYVDLCN